MKITIWDLDYYYAKNKVNCFNPDVMKISSYHKQLGDSINFVVSKDDIFRPYDLYYIIKNNSKLPHPPKEFFLNPKVRWWGVAYKPRIKWKMSDAMLGCRPDYQLYPERNTAIERSEQVRLFNNDGKPLQLIQDWTNSYRNKFVIVTDPTIIWNNDSKIIIAALNKLIGIKKVSFFEPIELKNLLYDKVLRETFLNLNFSPGSIITWTPIKIDLIDRAIDFVQQFKEKFPNVKIGEIVLDWADIRHDHWDNKQFALNDFETIKKLIIRCKKEGFKFTVKMPQQRLDTPYFEVFEIFSNWTHSAFEENWLEWLSKEYGGKTLEDARIYWSRPHEWHEMFREMLRQTWADKEFILSKWKESKISENEIPWNIWKEEFKYGL